MDQVDEWVLNALADLHCSFLDEPVKPKLTDLGPLEKFEALVRCLWAVQPDTRTWLTGCRLPPQMATRFRIATDMATALQGLLGCEVGYHTVLYGTVAEMRRLLIALVERLPKDCPQEDESTMSTMNVMERLRAALRIRLNEEPDWVPEFCRRLGLHFQSGLWWPDNRGAEYRTFHTKPTIEPGSDRQRDLIAQILEMNTGHGHGHGDHSTSSKGIRMEAKKRPIPMPKPRRLKPALPPKPSDLQSSIDDVEENRNRLLTVIDRCSEEVFKAREETIERQIHRARIVTETRQLRLRTMELQEKDEDTRLKRLMSEDGESKLIDFITDSTVRYEHLQKKWNLARSAMITAIDDARGNRSIEMVRRFGLARERCRVLETEMVNCHQLEQRLNRQLTKVDEAGKGDGRRVFTRRIFEVVANVRKQEEEIGRVLESTRLLQKEIAQLTGNLDRTFTAVEERLYRDAQRDLTLQKAYKILLRIHEECRLLTSAVEASGALVRETDEVVDQTETETLLRGGDAQLELLLADLAQTRQSNIQLSMLMSTV